jgi:hypothetical protein
MNEIIFMYYRKRLFFKIVLTQIHYEYSLQKSYVFIYIHIFSDLIANIMLYKFIFRCKKNVEYFVKLWDLSSEIHIEK